MRVKSMLVLAVFLMAAAVGLAMASTGSAASSSQQQTRPQERPVGPRANC